jgi:hypothetical protein
MLAVKNKNLININKKDSVLEAIIKRYSSSGKSKTPKFNHLSHVLHELPSGFVYKEETGMGATTLEIKSERDSIIVEPIKITASSKAFKHNCLYVGSETKYHNKKSPSKDVIKAYSNDKSVKNKKIIVVADSLPKVIEAIGPSVFKDYFLLIDEIDSFQLDSSYRKSMEGCIELYKKFLPDKRAMLSATKIDFSDPVLKNEPITEMKYEDKKPRTIKVFTTNGKDINGVVIDKIITTLKTNPNDKIFVAYNSVNGCFSFAEHLIANNILKKGEVKILCSSASKNAAKEFYNELDSDILPGKVNFFTSAYFTGFDLNESYHLVSVSGNKNKIQALSDRRLKQIAGRSRTGLLSEIIIHDIATNNTIVEPTEIELIEAAQVQVESHNCMKKHYNRNPFLRTFISDINDHFLKVLEAKELRLIRKDEKGVFFISYLNIDAILEGVRVRKELYLVPNALSDVLSKNGDFVMHHHLNSKTVIKNNNVSNQDRDSQVEAVIEILKNITSEAQIKAEIKTGVFTSVQEKIAKDFLKVFRFIETQNILDLIKKSILGKRDLREYNRIINSAVFHILPKSHLVVNRLNVHFPINGKYTSKEILYRMNLVISESQIPKMIISEKSAVAFLNTFYKTYRKRNLKDGIDYITIKGENPFGLKILKTKNSITDTNLFSVILSYVI